jgi:Holliday junction resolvase
MRKNRNYLDRQEVKQLVQNSDTVNRIAAIEWKLAAKLLASFEFVFLDLEASKVPSHFIM